MKYAYAYKTSDGIRHEDSMNATSREEVFAELRKRGIKAIKVVATDGSKANGEVRGIRKRVVLAIVCFAVIVTGGVVYMITGNKAGSIVANAHIDAPKSRMRNATPLPRQMIPGDRGRIAEAAASLKSAPESVDLKRIVTRIKGDLRRFLAAGGDCRRVCRGTHQASEIRNCLS